MMTSLKLLLAVIVFAIGNGVFCYKPRNLKVWIAEDVAAIVHGVRKNFKCSFSGIHSGKQVEAFLPPGKDPVCNVASINPFFLCANENLCFMEATQEDFFNCVIGCLVSVLPDVPPVSEDCFACIVSSFPNADIVMSECTGLRDGGNFRKMNTNGLLILSKKKLSHTRSVDFFPSTSELVVRGYLSAKVKGIPTVCTHLSSDALPGYPEFDLAEKFGFTSYTEQQAYETQLIITAFRRAKQIILLGDWNTGLASAPGIQAFMEDSFKALAATFDTKTVDKCTFCPMEENPYNLENENQIVDHVFTNCLCIKKVRRVFTQTDQSVLVGTEMFPLSDHYGVEAKILPARACRL